MRSATPSRCGGLRYTNDKKHFNTVEAVNVAQTGPSSVDTSKNKVNWDLSGTYKLNRDVNLYTRAATGFRAEHRRRLGIGAGHGG